jgi:diaminohydroxyphosphoribosylaminopyrimidine deaminase/5-amino-6-(5-phosphoribosylamino)uracil reductase
MFTPQDYFFMRQALLEAEKARFISDPNPRVGCVIVKNQQIIGTGFTQATGSHHAEIMAIRDVQERGGDLTGATVYVTLEPCCHFGKTPPCVDALIAANVSTVIVGATDPNPFVMGKGIEKLRAHHITVQMGLLEKQSMALNAGFMKRMQTGMPWVRLKIASSQDGITALSNGQSQWITGEEARLDGHRWRAQASVLLTGIGTVLADDPQLNVRGLNVTRQPLKAIIDSKLDISPSAKILATGQSIIFCAKHDTEKMNRLFAAHPHLKIIPVPNASGKVDLAAALKYLADQYHANEVHVEAGFKLNGSLLREGCVDEILHYQAPILLGHGIGLANLNSIENLSDASRWQVMDRVNFSSDQRIRLVRLNSH